MTLLTRTLLLLVAANIFMLFAWYLQLKNLNEKPWFTVAILIWGVAFFEYSVRIPAMRMGYTQLSAFQLHMLQIIISLLLLMPFSIFILHQPFKTDYFWAGLCLALSAYFIFRRRSKIT